jgi:ADP-dependent NAD(P)H-hydrate dehydratase / NAD(P)H-hydrate epimerase
MRQVHSVAQVRGAEAALMARLPDGVLMQRAAAGLARRVAQQLSAGAGGVYGGRVALLVGAGNNGADALWAGARLAARGARVDALLVGTADAPAHAALAAAGGRSMPAEAAASAGVLGAADVLVDGIVGIGGRGPLRPAAADLVGRLASSTATVIAVDVPSGVDADTGVVVGPAIRADITVTFGTLKPGLVLAPGAAYAGAVELVDIGLDADLPPAPTTLLDAVDVDGLLPRPGPESTKYRRGVLGVVAGSDTYPGAAALCVGGALRAGAGMVRCVSVAHPVELVRQRWPEAVVTVVPAGGGGSVADPAAVLGAGQVQAWVIGPGFGTDDDAAGVLAAVLGSDVPVLVDADGLTVLARHPGWVRDRSAPTLLTPHLGEFARLTGVDVEAPDFDRLHAARRAAADLGATVLLKGAGTVVVDPDGRTRVNSTGTARLATAGSGDVLSGAAGSLLAAGLSAIDAGSAAAFLHGLSARLAPASVLAADLVDRWPYAVRAVADAAGTMPA